MRERGRNEDMQRLKEPKEKVFSFLRGKAMVAQTSVLEIPTVTYLPVGLYIHYTA